MTMSPIPNVSEAFHDRHVHTAARWQRQDVGNNIGKRTRAAQRQGKIGTRQGQGCRVDVLIRVSETTGQSERRRHHVGERSGTPKRQHELIAGIEAQGRRVDVLIRYQ